MLLLQLLMLLLMLLFLLLTNLAIVLRRRLLSSLLHIVLYCSQPPIGLASGDGSGGDGGSKTLSLLSRSVCFPFLSSLFTLSSSSLSFLSDASLAGVFQAKSLALLLLQTGRRGWLMLRLSIDVSLIDWFFSPLGHTVNLTHTHTHTLNVTAQRTLGEKEADFLRWQMTRGTWLTCAEKERPQRMTEVDSVWVPFGGHSLGGHIQCVFPCSALSPGRIISPFFHIAHQWQ